MKKYKMVLETLQQAQEAFCHGPRVSCCMDWKKAVYWAAAAVLNAAVTF